MPSAFQTFRYSFPGGLGIIKLEREIHSLNLALSKLHGSFLETSTQNKLQRLHLLVSYPTLYSGAPAVYYLANTPPTICDYCYKKNL
jgi:hypothetical protein